MNLPTKIILLIVVVMLGVGLGSSLLVSRMMHDALEIEVHDQAVVAVQSLTEHIALDVINGEVIDARMVVRKMVERSQSIQYAYVVDFEGRLFTHSFDGGFPEALAAMTHQRTPSATSPVVEHYDINTGYVVDIAYPIIEGLTAHVHIALDEEHLLARVRALRNGIIRLTLLLAAAGIAIGIVVSRRLTRPLTELAGAMRDFGERKESGELEFRSGGEEIAEVAGAFNRMISGRRKAEEALEESGRVLLESQSVAQVGSYVLDVTSGAWESSPMLDRIFGIDADYEHSVEGWVAVVHSDDRQSMTDYFAHEVLEQHGRFDREYRIVRHNDGIERWVLGLGKLEFGPQGRQLTMIGTIQDITERKQAEEALLESEQKLRSIIESSTNLFYSHTPDHQLTFLSPQTWQFFDCDPEDAIEIWTQLATDNPINAKALEITDEAVRTGERPPPYELELIGKKGRIIWVEVNETPVSHDGKTVAVIGALTDITERKRAEKERRELQAQLNQAQKMEAVGRLAGGVAHDFNNMLGVILGHTELALDQADPTGPLSAGLQEIRTAAERSADLTQQLLAFARKQTATPRVLDLNETVEGMLEMLRRLIGEEIELVWLPDADVWPVKVDPSQIDQILATLGVNARDAIEGVGKVGIETGTTTFDEAYCADHPGSVPGDYVLLAVSDDGCGMDKEVLDKLFEPFFTTKKAGTGLGLATVYGIVKQNDGFINVYSEPRGGSTFKIYLPRHTGTAAQVQEERSAERIVRGNETILLVEDEPSILKMTGMMLEHQGYTVLAASTPGEAMRLASEHVSTIHLLMTDVMMPEMNGRELAKGLLPLRPDLKRLFMSGYTANVIADRGVIDEGVNFIEKPFSTQDLATKVREALDGN